MQRSTTRRAGAIALVVLVMVTTAGCQMVRQGTRCRAGSQPGRDATHVLFCTGGRWQRVMTLGQAAQILFAKTPVSVEALTSTITTTVGSTAPIELAARVTTLDGSPAAGVTVNFSFPSSGPSGNPIGSTGVATGADGIARIQFTPNTVAGIYAPTATVANIAKPATFGAANSADVFAAVTIVSGNHQTAFTDDLFDEPFVVRATDQFGNALAGIDLALDYDETVVAPYAGNLRTDAAGVSSIVFETFGWVGSDYVLIGRDMPDDSVVAARFDFTIAA